MRRFRRFSHLFLSFSLITVPTSSVFAQSTSATIPLLEDPHPIVEEFNPNQILQDADIFELGDMAEQDIQDFLSTHGTLGTIKLKDIDGIEKRPSAIIWRIATSYKINPKYLLVLLQKEQSLVEDPDPTQKQFDWATGYGVCDSCSMDDPRIQDFRGFASQLEWAAKQHREKYLIQILGKGSTIAGYAPGKTAKIDGKTITPGNAATAMLYSYTPHIHGNYNLWKIWQRWFSLTFPNGTIVQGNQSKKYYVLRYGQKQPIKNLAVVNSLIDIKKVVPVDDVLIGGYRLGRAISFANYSLVTTPDGKRYLLVGTTKRLIANQAAFNKFGFNEDELLEAQPEDLMDYTDAADITIRTTYPTGLLVKDPQGKYWYIENNQRRLVPDKQFLSLYFKNRSAKSWTSTKLNEISKGEDYRLQDGELVKGKTGAGVYVIEQGTRRAFVSGDDFEELGFQWKNVITLPDKLLEAYPLGEPIDPHAALPSTILSLNNE